ncbi:MAG: tetratricopeptide repeat protein [bacterium]|nr:tetratricopeptide repeat protein [bacterium]
MAIDVTDSTFQAEVLEASQSVPVLVDFWAEWCGPCRMVGPVVEALEQAPEYAGRFRLAKVNTDQNPEISGRFGISSIPAFKLFSQGEVAGEFVGALPEHALRRFLDQNLPDPALESLAAVAGQDPLAAARSVLEQGLQGEGAENFLWQGALELLRTGDITSAEDSAALELKQMLGAIPEFGSQHSDARTGLLALLNMHQNSNDTANGSAGADQVAVGPGFGETMGKLAELLADETSARGALDYFVGLVEAAPAAERGSVKDRVLLAFRLLGNQGPLVNEYRRKLSALLF